MAHLLTHDLWRWITVAAVVIGFIGCVIFVIRYHVATGGKWQNNRFGRYLMTRKLLLGILFGFVLINRFVEEWPGRRPILALLMLAFALQTFVPLKILLDTQERPDHDNERDSRTGGRRTDAGQ